MTSNVYILHHNDSDGYCAALAAYLKFGKEATYIPVNYGKSFPMETLHSEAEIYIVDFCYERVILDEIYLKVKKLVVIDHHESAEKHLQGLEGCVFNKDHAGCVLSWKYFHPSKAVPDLFKLVEDRDLWKFTLANSRQLEAGLRVSGKYTDLEYWKNLLTHKSLLRSTIDKGAILLDDLNGRVSSFVKRKDKYTTVTLDGLRVVLYNTTIDVSELGEAFYSNKELNIDYTISYFITGESTVVFNFRSSKESNVNVREIAEKFGSTMFDRKCISAGGHPNASGATFNLNNGLEVLKRLHSL